jgi:hypothetical protein
MHLQSGDGSAPRPYEIERRDGLRVEVPFPVIVRGVDEARNRFTSETLLDNFSACGLFLRLPRYIAPETVLFVIVRLSTVPAHAASAPKVALRGTVLRVEPRAEGVWGLAIEFRRHRFL